MPRASDTRKKTKRFGASHKTQLSRLGFQAARSSFAPDGGNLRPGAPAGNQVREALGTSPARRTPLAPRGKPPRAWHPQRRTRLPRRSAAPWDPTLSPAETNVSGLPIAGAGTLIVGLHGAYPPQPVLREHRSLRSHLHPLRKCGRYRVERPLLCRSSRPRTDYSPSSSPYRRFD